MFAIYIYQLVAMKAFSIHFKFGNKVYYIIT